MVCSRPKVGARGSNAEHRLRRRVEAGLHRRRFVAVISVLATIFVGLNALLQAISVVLRLF